MDDEMGRGTNLRKTKPRISTRIHRKIKIITRERGQGRGETLFPGSQCERKNERDTK